MGRVEAFVALMGAEPPSRATEVPNTMAKITPMVLIDKMSGKVCMHSDTYFAERNGTIYTGKICNPRTTAYSEDELKRQAKFTAATSAALTRMNTPATLSQDRAAFMAQKNLKHGKKTFRGYLFSIAYANATYDNGTETWSITWPSSL